MSGLGLAPASVLFGSANKLASARYPNPQPHRLSISRRVTTFVGHEFMIGVVRLDFVNPGTGILLKLELLGRGPAMQVRDLGQNFRFDRLLLIETLEENAGCG